MFSDIFSTRRALRRADIVVQFYRLVGAMLGQVCGALWILSPTAWTRRTLDLLFLFGPGPQEVKEIPLRVCRAFLFLTPAVLFGWMAR